LIARLSNLKVKVIDAFLNYIGEWKIVEGFPDIKIKYVNSFPGVD